MAVAVVHSKTSDKFHALLMAFVDVDFDGHGARVHYGYQALVLIPDVVGAFVGLPEHGHCFGEDFLYEGVDTSRRGVIANDLTQFFGLSRRDAEVAGGVLMGR